MSKMKTYIFTDNVLEQPRKIIANNIEDAYRKVEEYYKQEVTVMEVVYDYYHTCVYELSELESI